MPSLHQVATAKDGETFTAIGPLTITRQTSPKVSKNDKIYLATTIKSAGYEMSLMLWDAAAQWTLPLDVELTLRGKFSKNTYNGSPSLNCEELTMPEGAEPIKESSIQGRVTKPSMKECLLAGLRAVDFVAAKQHPELAEAAFTFAANALIQGVKPE